ncbi:PREDICTED: transcription factor HES-5-like [Nanorana parkeri]|uniref:transcription factor HES-5-like n=1 Tax=Nanorana parkeri TaxID=125878 RepID=UPI0008545C5C|nr:PREDICTED: transcription factor HES-5-like [Nanorana parkeri]
MAPSTVFPEQHKGIPKEKNKLRKPAVEKMRRDRINSSIEQLKVLLEKEFHRQQPNVKLEKADILEMAVAYLKQHGLPKTNNMVHHNLDMKFKDGYSTCFNEVLSFLSLQPKQRTTEIRLMDHFKSNEVVSVPSVPPTRHNQAKQAELSNSSSLWRPW